MIKIETLIVSILVIVAFLLSGALFYSQMCSMERAFEVKVESDLKQFSRMIKSFESDSGKFPNSLEELKTMNSLKTIADPWGNKYEYISNGTQVVIFTNGNPRNNKPVYHVETKKI